MKNLKCPACNGKLNLKPNAPGMLQCAKCGATVSPVTKQQVYYSAPLRRYVTIPA